VDTIAGVPDHVVAVCGAIVAVSTLMTNALAFVAARRASRNSAKLDELHTCLDAHIAESKELHVATLNALGTAAEVATEREQERVERRE
jgi:hypothetical protein